MPKTKRFQNLLKSVMAVPLSTESAPSNANSEPEMTSHFSQGKRQQAPSLQATRQATFSFQRTSQGVSSLQAAEQQTPSFQATRQATSSFQGTSLPAPSWQAVGQQSHSFQDQSTSSINNTSQGEPSVSPIPPQLQKNKRARESTHHLTVDGIDSQGNAKRLKLKTSEVLSLPQGVRVVVQFDLQDPIGEAAGLLVGFCGILATDCSIFPISFEKWPDMPDSYFEDCFDKIIKPLFSFMAPDEWARRYVYHSIVKKWGASRQKLWREFYDPLKTKEQHMANVPVGIARDQWTSFMNYCFKDKTMRMSQRNAENRKKLTNPHGGGSKSNARRRGEIIAETGRRPGRAEIYLITRKKEDGSYVSEGAKEICVLGKEHPSKMFGIRSYSKHCF